MPTPVEIPWNEVTIGQRIALSRKPDQFNPAAIIETGILAEICRKELRESPLRGDASGAWGGENVFRMEGGAIRQFQYWIACEPQDEA